MYRSHHEPHHIYILQNITLATNIYMYRSILYYHGYITEYGLGP